MSRRTKQPIQQGPKRSFLRRWLVRVLAALLTLAALALGSAFALVHSLDRPWVKSRLRAMVLSEVGVEIDYEAVRVRVLSGIEVDALVVRSPAPFRTAALDLARIGRLRVRWAPQALARGGPAIALAEIEQAALSVGVDENGATSLDVFSSPSPSKPPTPLSQLPGDVLGALTWLGRVRLENVSAALLRTENGAVVDSYRLQGLAAELDVGSAGSAPRGALTLGRPETPLVLAFERHQAGAQVRTAMALASLVAETTPSEMRTALDVQIRRQDVVPDVSVNHLAHAEVTLKFRPTAGRTDVELTRLDLGDGAATAKASAVLADNAPPIVADAALDADLAAVLRLIPNKLIPLRLLQGEAHARIQNLSLDRPTRMASASIEASVTDAHLALGQATVAVGDARLTLHGKPAGPGHAVDGNLSVGGFRVEAGPSRMQGRGFVLTVEANGDLRGPYTGRADLRFASFEIPGPMAIRDGSVQLRAKDLDIAPNSPLFSARGDISLEARAAQLETKSAVRVAASGVRFDAHLPLSGGRPMALDATLGSRRVRVLRRDGKELVDAPLRVALGLKGFSPDLDHPIRSRGRAKLTVNSDALDASLEATKRADALDYVLGVHGSQLGRLRPLLPEAAGRRISWDGMDVELRSSGRVDRVTSGEPALHQQTELEVTNLGIDSCAAQSVSLQLKSDGNVRRHDVHAELHTKDVVAGKTPLADDHLAISLGFDRARRSLQFDLDNEGLAQAHLALSAALDDAGRTISYRVDGRASHLAPLAPLLSKVPAATGFDASDLAIHFASSGSAEGLVSAGPLPGSIAVSSDIPRTLRGKGTAQVDLDHLHWSFGDREIRVPTTVWRANFQGADQQGRLETDLAIADLQLGLGRFQIGIEGIHEKTSATSAGSPDDRTVEFSQLVSIRAVEQDIVPTYPIRNVSSTLTGSWSQLGVFQVSGLRLENRAAGTVLTVKGGIDWGRDRHRLSLHTNLDQDLARVSNRPDVFRGKGRAAIDVSMESPDLRIIHTKSLLQFEDAHVQLAQAGIAVQAIDGEIPIVTDLTLGRRGVQLLHDLHVNPYMTLRYADQHPLLSSRSFLSIGRVITPVVSIAPFAANLRVDQNLVSLSQLEMGIRGGTITGNGILDWEGASSKVHAELRATGVRSSHDEPFDGNAALVIDAGDHSIEGRADILRIGKRHLLDLLDFQDPRHADPAFNRIRSALALGYPKSVRISFNHGFASAGVSLGGLAQLVSIDDVRGIPVGPLMERIVGSLKTEE